jgi:orotidine-5'-phosphate decarboxylase
MICPDKIFVALDKKDVDESRNLLHKLPLDVLWGVKIGTRYHLDPKFYPFLFYLKYIKKKIFLDFKYFDIDSTVMDSISQMVDMGVDYTTVHCHASTMQGAVSRSYNSDLKILAVTLLTNFDSVDMKRFYNYTGLTVDFVVERAKLAVECGCAGVIVSPLEVKTVRSVVPDNFLIVCPGVRPLWYISNDDQFRTGTPEQAIIDGANKLVIGRPIINNDDPKQAYNRIISEKGE